MTFNTFSISLFRLLNFFIFFIIKSHFSGYLLFMILTISYFAYKQLQVERQLSLLEMNGDRRVDSKYYYLFYFGWVYFSFSVILSEKTYITLYFRKNMILI